MASSSPVLLMLRPRAASERFVTQLGPDAPAHRLVISPRFEIVHCGVLPDLDPFMGLIFSSAHGVAAFRARASVVNLPVYAVGDATAQAARSAGFHTWSAEGDADALVTGLCARGLTGPLLHIRGEHTRGEIAARLTQEGISTREAVLYKQPVVPLTDEARQVLAQDHTIVMPLFSPRTGRLLADEAINAQLLVAAMSEAVAKATSSFHIRDLRVAPRPDSAAMAQTTLALLHLARAGEDTSSR